MRMRWALGAALALAGLVGCSRLLEVENPGQIDADGIDRDPAALPLRLAGAIGDFECAFGSYVVVSGLIGEELADATQTAARFPYDQRTLTQNDALYATGSCTALGVYTPLNTARAMLDAVARDLESTPDNVVPNRTRLLAQAYAYAGYSLVLLGEGFCTATISMLNRDGSITYGREMSRQEIWQEALARFDKALAAAQAANDATLVAMIRVGRARANLNLGRYTQAQQDAEQVPATFVFNATTSGASASRQNRVWAQNSATSTATSVGDPYRNLNDPRVAVQPLRDSQGRIRRSATGVELWIQTKYPTDATPIPLATGDEAQLIIAEVEARQGNLARAQQILATFRARGNQPSATFATREAALAEVIEQRRRELFLEGHHLGDLIRFNLPFNPPVGAPFPGGGVYGSQRCMPLPAVERRNNPNIPDS